MEQLPGQITPVSERSASVAGTQGKPQAIPLSGQGDTGGAQAPQTCGDREICATATRSAGAADSPIRETAEKSGTRSSGSPKESRIGAKIISSEDSEIARANRQLCVARFMIAGFCTLTICSSF